MAQSMIKANNSLNLKCCDGIQIKTTNSILSFIISILSSVMILLYLFYLFHLTFAFFRGEMGPLFWLWHPLGSWPCRSNRRRPSMPEYANCPRWPSMVACPSTSSRGGSAAGLRSSSRRQEDSLTYWSLAILTSIESLTLHSMRPTECWTWASKRTSRELSVKFSTQIGRR
jgi:hypothetical protein